MPLKIVKSSGMILKMHYYKATIQYEGTSYFGFQWQQDIRTVQGEINQALEKLIDGKVTTKGASRTDTGVHAMEQIVKISSSIAIDCSSFLEKFNLELPRDIRCLRLISCHGEFNPGVEADSKEYRYFFTNKTHVTKEETQFVANIANRLDIETIKECLKILHGQHDFCNFYSSGSNVKSTIREIMECELTEINPHTLFTDPNFFPFLRISLIVLS